MKELRNVLSSATWLYIDKYFSVASFILWSCIGKSSGTGPRFPGEGGRQPQREVPSYYSANFSWKLQEIEEIGQRGGLVQNFNM